MFARELFAGDAKVSTKMNANEAKRYLIRKGWSYRSAAKHMGICYQHLSDVLNGRRQSRRLLAAIATLPNRKNEAT